jgi:hypothetical protein
MAPRGRCPEFEQAGRHLPTPNPFGKALIFFLARMDIKSKRDTLGAIESGRFLAKGVDQSNEL